MILGIPSWKTVVTWSLWTPKISWSRILLHLWKMHICSDRSSTHSLFGNALKNNRRPSPTLSRKTSYHCFPRRKISRKWTTRLRHWRRIVHCLDASILQAKTVMVTYRIFSKWKSVLATLPLTVWWAALKHQVWPSTMPGRTVHTSSWIPPCWCCCTWRGIHCPDVRHRNINNLPGICWYGFYAVH